MCEVYYLLQAILRSFHELSPIIPALQKKRLQIKELSNLPKVIHLFGARGKQDNASL